MDTKSAKYNEVASPEEYSGSQTDSSNDQVSNFHSYIQL